MEPYKTGCMSTSLVFFCSLSSSVLDYLFQKKLARFIITTQQNERKKILCAVESGLFSSSWKAIACSLSYENRSVKLRSRWCGSASGYELLWRRDTSSISTLTASRELEACLKQSITTCQNSDSARGFRQNARFKQAVCAYLPSFIVDRTDSQCELYFKNRTIEAAFEYE
jgi:hypothetical protein